MKVLILALRVGNLHDVLGLLQLRAEQLPRTDHPHYCYAFWTPVLTQAACTCGSNAQRSNLFYQHGTFPLPLLQAEHRRALR